MSQNGIAETSVGRIFFGRAPDTSACAPDVPAARRARTRRASRASDTQVELSGTTSVSNSGTARGVTGSDLSRSCSWNQ